LNRQLRAPHAVGFATITGSRARWQHRRLAADREHLGSTRMGLLQGLSYNLRGLGLGLKTPKLLLLGLIRFAAVIFITVLAVGFIVAYHLQLVDLVWSKPASPWLVWLWHLVAWLLVLLLTGVAALISYLAAQILFSVLIMDHMSRITEKLISGRVQAPAHVNVIRQFGYLIRQEIPRAVIPVLLTLTLMVLAWATPIGPFVTIILAITAAAFLAWDSTDLTPARRMVPFQKRLMFFRQTLMFHLGFGLLFLIPFVNILFLAFAPVGATLYYVETRDGYSRGMKGTGE
jgi:CysZ protein